jgi:hypothetical protein
LDARNAGNDFLGEYTPNPSPPFMRGILATNVAFSHCYPPLIYYLTERSIFKKCPPTGKSLKKALLFTRSKSLTAISCSRLRFDNQFAFRLSRSVHIMPWHIKSVFTFEWQRLRLAVNHQFPSTGGRGMPLHCQTQQAVFPCLPDFRDRLPCRLPKL